MKKHNHKNHKKSHSPRERIAKRMAAEEKDGIRKNLRELKKCDVIVNPSIVEHAKRNGVALKGVAYEEPLDYLLKTLGYGSRLPVLDYLLPCPSYDDDESMLGKFYGQHDVRLKNLLGALELYSRDYLYCAFSGNTVKEFLTRGSYRGGNLLDALTFFEADLTKVQTGSLLLERLYELAASGGKPLLGIYRADAFRETDNGYKFRNPLQKRDAVKGVVRILYRGTEVPEAPDLIRDEKTRAKWEKRLCRIPLGIL